MFKTAYILSLEFDNDDQPVNIYIEFFSSAYIQTEPNFKVVSVAYHDLKIILNHNMAYELETVKQDKLFSHIETYLPKLLALKKAELFAELKV